MSVSLDPAVARVKERTPEVPGWALRLLGPAPAEIRREHCGLEVSVLRGKDRALISVIVPAALGLPRAAFEDATSAAYEAVRRELTDLEACNPLRLWNFIPELLAPLEGLPHRYMAFNAGRYRSYGDWFDQNSDFSRHIPTATGVGHEGADLRIYCLSCVRPGTAIENPRQISSYRYSERYGPLPPCFARATRIGNDPRNGAPDWLLVGGTASVLGEQSAHLSDLQGQIRETFLNLAAVVAAGDHRTVSDPADSSQNWARYRHLRVYYVKLGDLPTLAKMVEQSFTQLDSIEYLQAELCRPELLVEIEGVAELDAAKARS